MHRQFLISQISEQRAKLAELDRQSPQEAERSTVGANIAKLEASEANGVVALPNAG
jgi:hemolysin D